MRKEEESEEVQRRWNISHSLTGMPTAVYEQMKYGTFLGERTTERRGTILNEIYIYRKRVLTFCNRKRREPVGASSSLRDGPSKIGGLRKVRYNVAHRVQTPIV